MERLTGFPFSVGCTSHSSIDVVESQPKKSNSSLTIQTAKTKNLFGRLLPFPKPNISARIQKAIKSISNIFRFYQENDDDAEDREIEIGFPTDVQHVAHIGWDGFNGDNTSIKSWDKGPDILALPTISLKQFEQAMAAQSNGPV